MLLLILTVMLIIVSMINAIVNINRDAHNSLYPYRCSLHLFSLLLVAI